jgi:carboxypeptidase PM20D1
MSKLVRWSLSIGAALSLVAAGLVIRTETFDPAKPASPNLAPPILVNADQIAAHLSAAIKFKTISHQNPSEDEAAPFEGLRDFISATYPKFHNVAKRELIAGGTLIYTWAGSDASLTPIILMAHQDVVPVAADAENQWQAPPFSGEIRDGSVWGRGTLDDKGSLITLLEAAEALAAQGFVPKRTIMIISGHNEEVSGAGAGAAAALLEQRGIKAEFVLDEGMIVMGDHPLTKKPAALIGVTEKGYGTLRVTARAAGGHSSSPPEDTAVRTLAKAIVAITDHPFPMDINGPFLDGLRQVAPDAPFFSRMAIANSWLFEPILIKAAAASPAGAASLHTTIAPTMLQGSPKDNVLPSAAIARINYRLSPVTTGDDILARAKSAVGTLPVDFDFEVAPRPPSRISSTTSPVYGAMTGLIGELFQAPTASTIMIGGTDGRQFEGIAKDVYRFLPIELLSKDVSMYHGQNEHVSVEGLGKMTQFYARLMVTMTQ